VAPSVHPLNHLQWQQQEQEHQLSPVHGVFERMLPGEEPRSCRSHITIQGTALFTDASIPALCSTAQSGTSTGTRFLAVDTIYSLEPTLCDQLNSFLEGSKFGPFEYVSSAVFRLLQLRRKRSSKADELEQLLAAFAEQHHGSLESMMQWPQLLNMKKQRDEAAHPFSASLLRKELADNNPDLIPVRGALEMLLSTLHLN